VYVTRGATVTADRDFGLRTQFEVVAFVGNGGVETPAHANTEEWKNNPNANDPIYVDSYDFYSGPKYGYLAFMYNPTTKKWMIKSFKANDRGDPRFLALGLALKKAGL
jgi:hypothetical protein